MADYRPKMEPGDYADLLDLPHHVSARHPQMDRAARAAQFNAYQALTGYGDLVREEARETERFVPPDEEEQDELEERLREIVRRAREQPEITVTRFEYDEMKEGGRYTSVTGSVRRVDTVRRVLVFSDGKEIPLELIRKIGGRIFEG